MGFSFFSGSYDAKLDEKNRFVLPQAMRLGLVENGELQFSLALGLGGCIAIYRKSDIEKMVKRFQSKQHLGKYQKFFTIFFSTLHHTTCDKLGRVSLPPILKRTVGIKQEIIVAGVLDKIELWPKEVYEERLRYMMEGTDPDNDLRSLAESAFALLQEEETIQDEQ